jgi:hypothetical protein
MAWHGLERVTRPSERWREVGGLHLHSTRLSRVQMETANQERCHTSSLSIPPLLSFERLITTTFIQQDGKRGVILLCLSASSSRLTHRPSFLYPVSTPFILRASHPSARGHNHVVANNAMLAVVYRSFCKFRFDRWQKAARRRHDAMMSPRPCSPVWAS